MTSRVKRGGPAQALRSQKVSHTTEEQDEVDR